MTVAVIFSTHVEVFLSSRFNTFSAVDLLHARGGVSENIMVYKVIKEIFSTHVEVFLKKKTKAETKENLLHARGGVSNSGYQKINILRSSPRTWRCF